MKIILSEQAKLDLRDIYLSIAEFVGIESAEAIIADFEHVISLAAEQPLMGVVGIVGGTRELYPRGGKYRLVYECGADELYIITIMLAKREYP